uniref:Uncharacterized protein n=1 Tax=Oryza rufipogon TaxID=4529 RepID=A0A0E0NHR9_ORYRU
MRREDDRRRRNGGEGGGGGGMREWADGEEDTAAVAGREARRRLMARGEPRRRLGRWRRDCGLDSATRRSELMARRTWRRWRVEVRRRRGVGAVADESRADGFAPADGVEGSRGLDGGGYGWAGFL